MVVWIRTTKRPVKDQANSILFLNISSQGGTHTPKKTSGRKSSREAGLKGRGWARRQGVYASADIGTRELLMAVTTWQLYSGVD